MLIQMVCVYLINILGEVIKAWYNNTLKPEIKKDTSVDQKLKKYVVTDQIGDSSEE